MHDHVAFVDELIDSELVEDRALHEAEMRVASGFIEIAQPARREVVEGDDVLAAGEEGLAQMGTDEAATAGDKHAHRQMLAVTVRRQRPRQKTGRSRTPPAWSSTQRDRQVGACRARDDGDPPTRSRTT